MASQTILSRTWSSFKIASGVGILLRALLWLGLLLGKVTEVKPMLFSGSHLPVPLSETRKCPLRCGPGLPYVGCKKKASELKQGAFSAHLGELTAALFSRLGSGDGIVTQTLQWCVG